MVLFQKVDSDNISQLNYPIKTIFKEREELMESEVSIKEEFKESRDFSSIGVENNSLTDVSFIQKVIYHSFILYSGLLLVAKRR